MVDDVKVMIYSDLHPQHDLKIDQQVRFSEPRIQESQQSGKAHRGSVCAHPPIRRDSRHTYEVASLVQRCYSKCGVLWCYVAGLLFFERIGYRLDKFGFIRNRLAKLSML